MMQHRRRFTTLWLLLSLIMAIGLGLSILSTLAHADTCTWDGGTGDWDVASNWSCGIVPDDDDTAIINSGTVNLTSDVTVQGLGLNGGTLQGSANITVTGLTTWSGGTIQDAGTFYANGGLTISGGTKYFNTRTLNIPVSATATWTPAIGINLYNGATINNNGTWDVQNDADLVHISGDFSTFNNSGSFKKTGGTSITDVHMNFNNTGTVDVQTGTMHFDYDLTNGSGGVVEIHKGATLTVDGTLTNNGTMKQTQTVNASTVEFLHITNSGGSTDKYRGVIINTSGNMGDTTVEVSGNQTCSTDGGWGSTVKRCYEITPTTSYTSTITFYYLDSEGNDNSEPDVYHWNGSSWDLQVFDARNTSGDPNWVRARAPYLIATRCPRL